MQYEAAFVEVCVCVCVCMCVYVCVMEQNSKKVTCGFLEGRGLLPP